MKGLIDLRLDLGLRRLVPEWRALLKAEHAREDVISGLTVACIAVPLSLAIALASGVPPAIGLFTAIVAGVVCAIFGGTPLAVSGPAAAMAVLIASVVQTHGIGGLLVVGLLCGLLQMLTGVLGLGKLIRLVPVPVVEGFTAGIGAIILIGQLPRVLGLPPPEQSHVVDVITHIWDLFHQAKLTSVLIAFGTLALVFGLPKLHKRIPAPLLGVAIPTAIVAALGVDTATIGALPTSLPVPSLPKFPEGDAWGPVLATAFIVYALASLESLLSSSAVDKLSRGNRHDPDQELIGQGLGNVAVALVGGIPVTGVIARSALNVQAGGKTRRSAIIHSIALLASIFLFSKLMARIPIAALAGVLFSVAIRMLDPRKLAALYRVSRSDAIVYVTTFLVIVGVDLIKGVQWGIVAALAIAAVRLGQTHTRILAKGKMQSTRFVLSGPITFLSSLGVERLRTSMSELARGSSAVLDLSGVSSLDSSGAEMIVDLVGTMKARDMRVAVFGLKPELARKVTASDHAGVMEGTLAETEQEATRILMAHTTLSARQRLVFGVEHYRREHLPRYATLFERLAHKQSPHTLFITCSDSRIQPALMTSTDPGELFLVRNVGNMVPKFSPQHPPSSAAAIEYAVAALGVSEIIVCAHSRCGAIGALLQPNSIPKELYSLQQWLTDVEARDLVKGLPSGVAQDDVAKMNALLQLDHLQSYPVVAERLAEGKIRLSAWFFDVSTGEIEEYDAVIKKWAPFAARDNDGDTPISAPAKDDRHDDHGAKSARPQAREPDAVAPIGAEALAVNRS